MYLGAEPRVVRGRLSAGRRGTAETLAIMRRLADQGAKEITVREAAVRAVQAAGIRGHDFAGELAAVFRFVRDRIRFTRDPIGTEWLQAPAYTLSRGVGDCDDKATLLVAMLKSIGAPAALRFKVIGETPAGFSHVYVEAAAGGRRIPMDPTRAGTPFGWELPNPAMVGGARA